MKKVFLTVLIACFAMMTAQISAQKVYMVVKGETSTPYYRLVEAIDKAEPGSTVYIPSGVHTIDTTTLINNAARTKTIQIRKKLNLIGAGAEQGTLHATVLDGTIVFTDTGANESYISGFTVTNVYWHSINSVIMKRCKVTDIFYVSGNGRGNMVQECSLPHAIHRIGLYGNAAGRTGDDYLELRLTNNVISSLLNHLKEAIVLNNVFTYNSGNIFNNCDYCTISNNILTQNFTYNISGTYNSYTYNLTVGAFATPASGSTCTVANNIENIPADEIFADNYHLQEECVGVGAGSDGTDVGIYGGANPAKELRIPANPSFTEFTIGGGSDKDGKLPVVIKAEAQQD